VIRTNDFDAIAPEFDRRVRAMVYCSLATIDAEGRPRTRVIHPIWDGATGWVTSEARTAKVKQIAANPAVSLAYIAEPFKPVFVECRAAVQNDSATRQRVWDLYCRTPPPYGADMTEVWGELESPRYCVLRLDPWQIELYDLLNQQSRTIWRREG
jgi:general stress protein 26